MPITLTEAKELSQDKLTNFVIDEFVKDPLLDRMVFDDTVKPQGGQTMTYAYNRVSTQPTAAGRAINSEYTPQETKTTQFNVNLTFVVDDHPIKLERTTKHLQVDIELRCLGFLGGVFGIDGTTRGRGLGGDPVVGIGHSLAPLGFDRIVKHHAIKQGVFHKLVNDKIG